MSANPLQDLVAAEVRRLAPDASVEVSLVDGVATLVGEAPDEASRRRIEQGLLQLAEVADVHNHLRVPPPVGDLRSQLVALLARDGVSLPQLEIEAADGLLTLYGRAEAWFDRDAAERAAWTLPGVKAVANRIILPEGAVTPEDGGDSPR